MSVLNDMQPVVQEILTLVGKSTRKIKKVEKWLIRKGIDYFKKGTLAAFMKNHPEIFFMTETFVCSKVQLERQTLNVIGNKTWDLISLRKRVKMLIQI